MFVAGTCTYSSRPRVAHMRLGSPSMFVAGTCTYSSRPPEAHMRLGPTPMLIASYWYLFIEASCSSHEIRITIDVCRWHLYLFV